jgi:hypothetical protein
VNGRFFASLLMSGRNTSMTRTILSALRGLSTRLQGMGWRHCMTGTHLNRETRPGLDEYGRTAPHHAVRAVVPALISIVAALCGLSGCGPRYVRAGPLDPAAAIAPGVGVTRNVVLVSIDGLRPDAIARFAAPTLQRLVREERACRAYVSDEQRRLAGCIGGRR